MERLTRTGFVAWTIALAAVSTSHASEPAAPLAIVDPQSASGASDVERPFEPGEFVRFSLQYLGMEVGEFRAEVGEREYAGRRVWPIEATGETEGLIRAVHDIKENYTSMYDPASGRSIGSVRSMRQNDFWQREETRFDGNRVWVHTRKPEGESERWLDTMEGAHDLVSAIYWLRTQPLAVGTALDVPVFTPRQSWTLKVRVTGRERLESELGPVDAFVLKLRTQFSGKLASERELTLWITDDARRLPTKVEAAFLFGSVSAKAVEYRRGALASR